MKIELGVESINKAISRLNNFSEEVTDIAPEKIVDTMLWHGVRILNQYNSSAPKSGIEDNTVDKRNNKDGSGSLILFGPNAIYDEFGTGEEGASDPHPLKNYYDLNPYNSGPFIFYNELAGRYQWRYQPMAGRPYFTDNGLTSGIPSGKMMYNTANDLNDIKTNVAKRRLNDTVKKFK